MSISGVMITENILEWTAIKMQKLTFGKFKGKTVGYVFMHQPSYLAWAVSKNLVELDKVTEKKLMRLIELESQENLMNEIAIEYEHEDWGCRDDGL